MRHKMITLCPTSYEIAQKMDNFSAWVRTKLLEEAPNTLSEVIFYEYKCPVCKKITISDHRRARDCIQCKYPTKFHGVKE